ncbi:hypothetical protein O7626_03905 [Micromonospora sp. WMMD1102]|uniref:hypothetical protein n=1 Tax=Micromonospora sp. WMMD1102 TaxID=3016105 RepID=UPI0024158A2B|nr:hypothetical protein [Micromonospora sp. WMMD1102]MDG4785082.1 hypothetical protein [Micromonospora sp. WMMD1102]
MRSFIKNLRSFIKNLLVSAMVATTAILPITTGPAQAAPTTFNLRTQFLTNLVLPAMQASHVERRIELAEGTYGWFPWVKPDVRAKEYCGGREIKLGAGWYTWHDVLLPQSGYYIMDSWLIPDNENWPAVLNRCDFFVDVADNYRWGSGLDPHF